ncbi:MAG: KR domain-containing protein, partial [Myxococcales bacterium]|nr:KR domain-containing protein [Myxococcales bacterium]
VTPLPRPVQPELPVWVTAASNPQTFERAGSFGANLLTHMLDQDAEPLLAKLGIYRSARAKAGHEGPGHVTVMIHTFVGEDLDATIEHARVPYTRYLKANSGLIKGLAASRGRTVDPKTLSPEDLDEFTHFLYDRFVHSRSLIGTPDSAWPLVEALARGVDEIACLLDFGPDVDLALSNLTHLDELRARAEALTSAPATAVETRASPRTETEPLPEPRTWSDLEAIRSRCSVGLDVDAFYARIGSGGASYGPTMRTLKSIWIGDDEILGRLELSERLVHESDRFTVHPTLLDSCFLLLAGITSSPVSGGLVGLPTGVSSIEVLQPPGRTLWCSVRRGPDTAKGPTGDVVLFDDEHRVIGEAKGLQVSLIEAGRAEAHDPAELCYHHQWRPVSTPSAGRGDPREWLVVSDAWGLGPALATALERRGHRVRLHDAPGPIAELGDVAEVVHLRDIDVDGAPEPALFDAATAGVTSALHTAKALLRHESTTRLTLVTRGAQAGLQGTPVVAPTQAMTWGFGRVFAAEVPQARCRLVDLDPTWAPDRAAESLVDLLLSEPPADPEDQWVLRREGTWVPRLVRIDSARSPAPALSPDGAYAITGGLGDIGLALGHWMADRGATHLRLLARTEAPQDPTCERDHHRARAVASLRDRGVTVDVDVVDMTSPDEVARWWASRGSKDVRGIVHAAAVVDGATIDTLDEARLHEVHAAKAKGGWALHHAVGDAPLDFFTVLSAIPGLVGLIGAGAANYSAANTFVDALVAYRRMQGLVGNAVAYGPWRELGMAVRGKVLAQLERSGIGSMGTADALTCFGYCLADPEPLVAVASLSWSRIAAVVPGAAEAPLLWELIATPESQSAESAVLAELASTAPAQRLDYLHHYVAHRVGSVLGIDASTLDQQSLQSLGLDSLMSIEIKNRIERELDVAIPLVTLLKGPSVRSLASTLLSSIDLSACSAPETADAYDELVL